MKKTSLIIGILFWTIVGNCLTVHSQEQQKMIYKDPDAPINDRIVDLLGRMTIEEKAGQLNQLNGGTFTGPKAMTNEKATNIQLIKEGKVGSFLNITGATETRKIQKIAVEQSRLGIPLLFALDVIHGYQTIFPVPLAEACSWDLEAIEENASVAAAEATSAGVHWTFAPMCDISNDPRWGRVMEGAGEDPYLGGLIAAARVKGFQGNLSDARHLMACVKHFAAYGAVEAGREYNHVDVSRFALWNKYLPPYKAAVDAGAATVMNAFNVFEGVPVTANSYLITDILKNKWNFKGFTISDWNSFTEMILHGYAASEKDALIKAMKAGSMMEMNSRTTVHFLPQLVKEGVISEKLVDDAVSRILYYKFKLGLFDNPYLYCDEKREKAELMSVHNREVARKAACSSIILLKNEKELLPVNSTVKVALVGYYARSKADMFDFWIAKGNYNQAVSIREGLASRFPDMVYTDGYNPDATTTDSLINRAVELAKNADVVLVNIGLSGNLAGEDRSLADIKIPEGQQQLLRAIRKTGKPLVALISSGRPMVLTQIKDYADAILQCWIPGTETGNAVADILTGTYNPTAKTVMSFPYDEGQIPVYYNCFNTGRPYSVEPGGEWFSRYRDIPNKPLYPFGFGLSYSRFSYSNLTINKTKFTGSDSVIVTINLKNTGKYYGEEIVQLYIQDPVASLIRPVKELKAFQKITFKAGEEKQVRFVLSVSDLGFYTTEGELIVEPGEFRISVGGNSEDLITKTIELVNYN